MRSVVLVALAVPLLLVAGCVTPAAEDAASTDALSADASTWAKPEVTSWSGHIVASELDGPSHIRPTEDVLWPIQQEGILFAIDAVPQAMEVMLEWSGEGELMIMLHSHKEHGSNVYIEHVTKMSSDKPQCLRVPAADLTEGEWQVMVHSNGAMGVDYKLSVALVGAAGKVVEDDRHGHWLQDGAFEVDEHEIEACQLLGAPAK